jgi:hypothetical protein
MRNGALASALVALAALGPAAAWADGSAAPASSGASTGTVTMTPMADATASGVPAAAAPSGSASATAPAAPAPGTEAVGMTWSTKKHKGGHVSVAHHASSAAETSDGTGAVVPGFEMLGDGSTRVFVQMPKQVTYTAKAGPSSITYVLKDLHVDKRNNYNPLVTVHFNTPVTSARLVPHGKDLWLVVALRAKAQPTATLQPAKDGGAVLQLDFAKGNYLPSATAASDGADAPASGRR